MDHTANHSRRITFRVDETHLELARQQAQADGLSLNDVARQWLAWYAAGGEGTFVPTKS